MGERVSNRRETHKKHTRHALEDAALSLFAQQGYEQTTVEEIAAGAGVSVRTFFRYFSSKQHVLFGDVAHDRVEVLGAALAARPADEAPVDSVRKVLDELDVTDPWQLDEIRKRVQLLASQPSLIGRYLIVNQELREQISLFVAKRCDLPLEHAYPLMVGGAAAAAWDTALWSWLAGQSPDLAEARRSAFAQLISGVRPPERSHSDNDSLA